MNESTSLELGAPLDEFRFCYVGMKAGISFNVVWEIKKQFPMKNFHIVLPGNKDVTKKPLRDAAKSKLESAITTYSCIPEAFVTGNRLGLDLGLRRAAKSGHYHIAKFLIAAGASLIATDQKGMTPLLFAAEGGHKKIAALVIVQGRIQNLVVDVENAGGLDAVLLAYRNHRKSLARRLVRVGFKADSCPLDDLTPFQCTIIEDGEFDFIKELLADGTRPVMNDHHFGVIGHAIVAIGHAIARNNLDEAWSELLQFLIAHGADVDGQDLADETLWGECYEPFDSSVSINILIYAIFNVFPRAWGHEFWARESELKGADIAKFLQQEERGLHILELLITHGADVNFNDGGFTPIVAAIKIKKKSVIELLLNYNALVQEEDIERARQTGDPEISSLIANAYVERFFASSGSGDELASDED